MIFRFRPPFLRAAQLELARLLIPRATHERSQPVKSHKVSGKGHLQRRRVNPHPAVPRLPVAGRGRASLAAPTPATGRFHPKTRRLKLSKRSRSRLATTPRHCSSGGQIRHKRRERVSGDCLCDKGRISRLMADTKISALAAVGTLHSDDLLVDVDVHDTTMAASGTDKKLTVNQLIGGATSGQVVVCNSSGIPVGAASILSGCKQSIKSARDQHARNASQRRQVDRRNPSLRGHV